MREKGHFDASKARCRTIFHRKATSRETYATMERLKVCEACQEYPSFQPPLTEETQKYWPFSGCCEYRSKWYGHSDSEVEWALKHELYNCPQCLHVWDRSVKRIPEELAPRKVCAHCSNIADVYTEYWKLFRKQEERDQEDIQPGFDCHLCAYFPAPRSFPLSSLCRFCKARNSSAETEMERHIRGCQRCRFIQQDLQYDPVLRRACEPCGYIFRGYVEFYAHYGLRKGDVQATPCNPEDCRVCFYRLKNRAFSRREVSRFCNQCKRDLGNV